MSIRQPKSSLRLTVSGCAALVVASNFHAAAQARPLAAKDIPSWAESAFFLEVDGQVIDTQIEQPSAAGVWLEEDEAGYAAPVMQDMNGDGRADLVVGTYGGAFRIYTNVGTKKNPRFQGYEHVATTDGIAMLWNGCCLGVNAEFVDLDRDGIVDMTASSYKPGGVYWFKGSTEGFLPRVMLTDKNGLPLFSGWKDMDVSPGTSLNSIHTLMDIDDDGDLDVIMGRGHQLVVRLNQSYYNGTYAVSHMGLPARQRQPLFSEFSVGRYPQRPITVGGESAYFEGMGIDGSAPKPRARDWDGDGDADLVVGLLDGSVWWLENIDDTSPYEFGAPQMLLPAGEHQIRLIEGSYQPVRGYYSAVDVADYNADGLSDLIVGFTTISVQLRDSLSAEERQAVQQVLSDLGALDASLGLPESGLSVGYGAWCRSGEKKYRDNPDALKKATELCDSLLPYLKERRDVDYSYGAMHKHGHMIVYLRASS